MVNGSYPQRQIRIDGNRVLILCLISRFYFRGPLFYHRDKTSSVQPRNSTEWAIFSEEKRADGNPVIPDMPCFRRKQDENVFGIAAINRWSMPADNYDYYIMAKISGQNFVYFSPVSSISDKPCLRPMVVKMAS